MKAFQKRTWAEVDLNRIKENYKIIRSFVEPETKICCVVKANAYGHGATELSKIYEELGADYLAVSNIEEALQIRHHNVTLPILILGYTDPDCAALLSVNNITQCVFSKEYGKALSENAVREKVNVKVHIKLDTGMGRIGFKCKDLNNLAIDEVAYTCKLNNLIPEGIFTHFASADEGENGDSYTRTQFECFMKTIDELKKKGITFSIRHCANSAAIFDYKEMHLDMVRAGNVLYGLQPSNDLRNKKDLKPAISLLSIVDYLKTVKEGECISYGREYKATKERKIATIPVGYADGLWRSNVKNGILVEIEGKFAPIVGRICMDQCMVDVTDIPECHIGSKVVIYGDKPETSIDRIAKINNTINYEVICGLGERVPRVYMEDGNIVSIVDYIVMNNY